jgi:hypothetical protein
VVTNTTKKNYFISIYKFYEHVRKGLGMFEVTLITPLLPTYQNKVQDVVEGRNNDGRSFKRCDVQDAYIKVVPQVAHACVVVNLDLNYHGNGNKSLKFWHNRLGHLYDDIILTLHNVLSQASSSCL